MKIDKRAINRLYQSIGSLYFKTPCAVEVVCLNDDFHVTKQNVRHFSRAKQTYGMLMDLHFNTPRETFIDNETNLFLKVWFGENDKPTSVYAMYVPERETFKVFTTLSRLLDARREVDEVIQQERERDDARRSYFNLTQQQRFQLQEERLRLESSPTWREVETGRTIQLSELPMMFNNWRTYETTTSSNPSTVVEDRPTTVVGRTTINNTPITVHNGVNMVISESESMFAAMHSTLYDGEVALYRGRNSNFITAVVVEHTPEGTREHVEEWIHVTTVYDEAIYRMPNGEYTHLRELRRAPL